MIEFYPKSENLFLRILENKMKEISYEKTAYETTSWHHSFLNQIDLLLFI